MKNYQSILVGFLLSLVPLLSFAQSRERRANWGVIEPWELEMTVYENDSSAAAVILSEYAEATINKFDNQSGFIHRRIKILNAAAYEDYATQDIIDAEGCRIANLAARITYVDDDGAEVTQVLGEQDFIKESVIDGVRQISFTFPNMRPGAVLEYKYETLNQASSIWVFDNDVPTMWSEYRRSYDANVTFSVYEHIESSFTKHTVDTVGQGRKQMIKERWVMSDVPAFQREKFMPPAQSLRNQVQLFLASGVDFGGVTEALDRKLNWGIVTGNYRRYIYDIILGKIDIMIAKSTEIIKSAHAKTEQEKVIAIYNYVRDHVETRALYGEAIGIGKKKTPKDLLKSFVGSPTEKNSLLVALLAGADLDVAVVILRKRNNGQLLRGYPSVGQFNRLIAAVKVNDELIFLDATDKLRPWNLLPVEDLVENAYLMSAFTGIKRFINIEQTRISNHKVLVEARIEEDLTLHADISTIDNGYRALQLRQQLAESDGTQLQITLDTILDDLIAGEVDSVSFENVEDKLEPFKTTIEITAEELIEESDDFLYISPVLFDRYDANLFTSETRKYDVDFVYPTNDTYMIRLQIPAGYEVDELPENKQFSMRENDAIFKRVVSVQGNVIQYLIQDVWTKSSFDVEDYQYLREYFDHMLELQDQPIVLRKVRPVVLPGSEDESDSAGGK